MRVPLPFPCDASGLALVGVEPERKGDRWIALVVDDAQVRDVRISQTWTSPEGEKQAQQDMRKMEQQGRLHVEGGVEAMIEADSGEDLNPYGAVCVTWLDGDEVSLFWWGDGSYDGHEFSLRARGGEEGEA